MAEEDLERAAVQRRERLRALRAAVDLADNKTPEEPEQGDDEEEREGEGAEEGTQEDHPQ